MERVASVITVLSFAKLGDARKYLYEVDLARPSEICNGVCDLVAQLCA